MSSKENRGGGLFNYTRKEIAVGGAVVGGFVLLVTGAKVYQQNSYNNTVRQEGQIMQEKGLFDEHPIVDLRSIPGFSANGNVSGGFLAINGEFKGKTQTLLQFAWKTNQNDEKIQIMEFPLSQIKFDVKADPNTKSTVSFGNLSPKKFVSPGNGFNSVAKDDPNLNNYVSESDFMILTLSQQNFDTFRAAK